MRIRKKAGQIIVYISQLKFITGLINEKVTCRTMECVSGMICFSDYMIIFVGFTKNITTIVHVALGITQ